MSERKRIYLCLAHMSDEGLEQKYIKEAFDTNWVVPLGPNVNAFEKDLEDFVNGTTESRNDGITDKRKHGETELLRELVPAINNLIFVRSTQERISELKMSNEVLEPLRYMMDRTASREHAIMTVGDQEMENFMRVASRTGDSVMFLDEESVVGKVGKRVEIMGGPFEGVTGVIRRVKRCKRVVVELEGIASVAIAFVPAALLREV